MSRRSDRWFKNRIEIDKPFYNSHYKEVLYEVITGDDDAGFGLAVADISHSEPHIHNRTTEVYTLISGYIYVFLGENSDTLVHLSKPGDTVTIPPGTRHYAMSAGKKSRVAVVTIPPWSSDDHVLTEPFKDVE